MIKLKDLRMEQTVKAAVKYIESGVRFIDLRKRFNLLCEYWHADEYDPGKLSLDVNDIARHIEDEPWIKDIAALPAHERTKEMHIRVVEDFISKYWFVRKNEISFQDVLDVLRVADPLSRRHILAQRVVIECIHDLKTEAQLRRLDRLMDALATNPRLEREFY